MGLFHTVLQRFGDLGNVMVGALQQSSPYSTAQPCPVLRLASEGTSAARTLLNEPDLTSQFKGRCFCPSKKPEI